MPPDSLALTCGPDSDRLGYATAAMRFARRAGVPEPACWKLGIVVAELVSNVRRHAHTGELSISVVEKVRRELIVVCRDVGPGLDDLELARRDGYSRGRQLLPEDSRSAGLGAGLGAIYRLMDEVEVHSRRGQGTTVIARTRF